jgi:hypothetical protein
MMASIFFMACLSWESADVGPAAGLSGVADHTTGFPTEKQCTSHAKQKPLHSSVFSCLVSQHLSHA